MNEQEKKYRYEADTFSKRDFEEDFNDFVSRHPNLEDDLSHEENVEHDKVRAFFIKCELDNFKNVLECLYKEKEYDKIN